jgi:hypothetical protein
MRRTFLLGAVGLLPVLPGVADAGRLTTIFVRSEDGTVFA